MDFRTITVLSVLMLDAVVRATPYATDGTKLDGFYHIRQLSSGRYLDAYDQAYFVPSRPGFEVVSRDEQYAGVRDSYDKTQFWYILGNDWGSYSLMQYTSGRFLDSCQPEVCKGHSGWQWDNVAVTQPANDSIYATTQRWVIQAVANTSGRQYADFHGRIIQSHTQMFLNSYSSADKDDQVYLSDDGTGNDTIWVFEHMNDAPVALLDGVFTLTQESSGRNLDADDKSPEIHSWTNEATFTERQHFLIRRVKGEVYTITHMSSGRLLGASVPDGEVNATVAPALITIGTQQQWMLVYIRFNTFVFQHVMTGRILSSLPYNESTGLVNAVMPSLAMYDGNASETVWKVRRVGIAPILGGMYTIRNKLTQRYLLADTQARTISTEDEFKDNSNDHWVITYLAGDTYEVYGNASKRVLEKSSTGNSLVLGEYEHVPIIDTSLVQTGKKRTKTVPLEAANNPLEQWFLVWAGGDEYYFAQAQKNTYSLYLTDNGGTVSMSNYTTLSSQIWIVEHAAHSCYSQRTHCPAFYECGIIDDWCGGNLTCTSVKSFANGTCSGANTVTGEPYHCHDDDHLCHCVAITKCTGVVCGTKEPDGCGGLIDCGACPPPAPALPPPAVTAAGGIPGGTPGVPAPGIVMPAAPGAAPGAAVAGVVPGAIPFAPGAAGATGAATVGGVPAPAPMPFAWNLITTSTTTFTTTTTVTVCLDKCQMTGWECGFEFDGCGKMLPCGPHAGSCKLHPLNSSGASYDCNPINHTCDCMKRTTCDAGLECGFQPDGCGGQFACGQHAGNCTGGGRYECKSNKCTCVPDTCGKRCGDPVDDGCGKKIQCSCTMANERCNRKKGICEHVPGPTPDPSIFSSTATTTAAVTTAAAGGDATTTAGGAPAPNAAVTSSAAPAPAGFVPPDVSPPPPGMPTTPPPLGLHPDIVGYYTYFYYIYYYFAYLGQKKQGRSDLEATAVAQKMAPVYAYEQLQFTFALPIKSVPIIPDGQFQLNFPNGFPTGLPPILPPTGAALLQKAPAVLSTLQTQKPIGRETMGKLLANSGIALESEDLKGNMLPAVVDVSMLQEAPSNRKFATLRQQRSALRGTSLGPEFDSL